MGLESLRKAIEDAEALLARLDRERQDASDRLLSLREQYRTAVPPAPPSAERQSLLEKTLATAEEKVALFRSLFRGREDVYPKYWRNERTRKSGYSPAYANEWVRGVCEKPRIKCGECPNRSFLKPLLDQWVAQLSLFLGVEAKSIGRVGGGKNTPTGRLDVAMIQSLGRLGEVDALVTRYCHVVVDECHHLPAVSFERVLGEVRARNVTGLTATPYRRDGHQPVIHMQCGPIQFAVPTKRHDSANSWAHRLVVRDTGFDPGRLGGEAGIQDIYACLAADEKRNQMIFDDVMLALEEGRSPILLTERKDPLDLLAAKMRKFARHIVVLKGGMKNRERRETTDRLAAIPDGEERLVLATGRYIGEGFDDARLDTLFLALPVSWKGTLVQYAGRLHRVHPGKREVRIYDYVDRKVPMLVRMFERRLRGYRAIGYSEDRPVIRKMGSGKRG